MYSTSWENPPFPDKEVAARRGVDSIENQWKNPVDTNKNTNKWQHLGGVTDDFWAPVTA
jgi:hypothetical protein